MKIKILIPVYNDWQSVSKLIEEIDNLSIDPKFEISIIIINDASNHDRDEQEKDLENKKIEGIIVGKAIYDGDIKLEDLAKEIN